MKFFRPRYIGLAICMLLISSVGVADDESISEQDKMFYYLGTILTQNLTPLALTESEIDLVVKGLKDGLLGNAEPMDDKVYGAMLNTLAQERAQVGAADEEAAGQAYIAKMAEEEGATRTESGIVIVEITAGTGKSPSADSVVKAHYEGTLRTGAVFDSSIERGEPLTISLSNVIPCWREGIPMMKEGGKIKITCPPNLAYGDRASGPIPGGSALTFVVELIEVVN
jgi:FKBP-type peptidyl-prolyl cis-trans isomerase FkpA